MSAKRAVMTEHEERQKLKQGLFFAKSRNEPSVSAKDTARFLRLSAKSRIYLSHYTDLQGLLGILSGQRLWLTRADLLNDLKEFQGADSGKIARSYTASFATTRQESVAMWWMYGLAGEEKEDGRIPVQLSFPVRAIRHELEAMRTDVHEVVEETDKDGKTVKREKRDNPPLSTEKLELFEILYLSNTSGKDTEGSILWNGNRASRKRCAGGHLAKWGPLDGYVKDVGWEYEHETRLALELSPSEKGKDIRQVSLPFKLPVEELLIRVGPGRFSEQWYKKVVEALSQKVADLKLPIIIKKQVKQSQYQIRFLKAQKKEK